MACGDDPGTLTAAMSDEDARHQAWVRAKEREYQQAAFGYDGTTKYDSAGRVLTNNPQHGWQPGSGISRGRTP